MDNPARRSARRVQAAGRRSARRVKIETRNVARKLGHHGADAVVEEMRSRGIAIDPAFVRQLLSEQT